ncbi:MAG: hypothetical protein CM15mP54_20940 [Paracoccaceae bacterium]|nr:MAG: hypothetical protein CM15mP54_20940 [Paracoccaceae bacterium]
MPFSPEVTKLFTDAGMLRRVVTRICGIKNTLSGWHSI